MTRITRLEAKGFKSFANKTEIVFGDGFNCILGPNGSGKSNVLDALCFVLGKAGAKGLRAEKSANLIYNGGKKKSPAKNGEVTIVFDNSQKKFGDFEELKITRIVQQSGQSKYMVNDKSSSRTEILDILSKDKINPDGYNIILQGDITHLIEMSTVERRGIVEEIAGIAIYEDKKEKALRELGRVDEKLTEADIVLAERKTYLQELRKERDQALKFKELDEKIKRNKATLVHQQKKKREDKIQDLESQAKRNKEELDKLAGQETKITEEIKQREQQVDEINKEVERRGEKEQVKLHKEVEALKVDVAVNKQRLETLENELEKVKARRDELMKTNKELFDKIKLIEKERDDIEKRISTREESIKKLETRVAEFRKKHNMEDASRIDGQIEEIDKKAEQIQEEIAKIREKQQEQLRDKDRVEIRLEQIDEKIAHVSELAKEHKKELEQLKNKKESFKKATKELSSALTTDSSLHQQLQTARGKLLSRKEELAKLEGQQASIQERLAGGSAISAVLELKKKMKGIHGTVSSLGKVKEEYALALEIAAGPRANSIVVETDEVAAKCIKHLRDNKLGVATFLPMNKLRAPERQTVKSSESVKGLAVDLIEYDPTYEKVFRYVFGTTVVVDTIDSARKLGIGKARMVTLKGDLMDTSGAMQGGFRGKQRGIGFQQKETSEKIEKLQKEVADLENTITRIEQERADNEEAITRLRELKAGLEGEIIKAEKSLHLDSDDAGVNAEEKKRLAEDSKRLDKELDNLMDAVTEKTSELGRLKIQKQKLRDQISAMRSPTVLAEMNTFDEKKQEIRKEIAELQGELRSSDSEVKNILGPETEKVKDILKQQDREKKAFEEEHKQLKQKLKEQETELKEKEKQEEKFFAQFKELFAKRQKLSDEMQQRNEKRRDFQLKQKEVEGRGTALSLQLASVKAELAGVEEELKQYTDIEPYKNKPEEDIKLEVREFERMVDSIGAVNMKALEIYERVESEYNELIVKKEKLGTEREDVLLMINEIDAKKRELFLKTFDVVNKNFQHFFSQLSRKGEAFLDLEDPKDPFNGGMTIKVKLSGKKFLDIRSLSGGEKTMTALAFLFAVQEHEPASFYVMDEVDAALDKHNSELLAKLIRKYCNRAQYVIISHNDGVISEADNLYGVSMDEHGVSKVTSLKI